MSTQLKPKLSPEYKYQVDTRTDMEKLLSDKIVKNLSSSNFERLHSKQANCDGYKYKNKYFFICFTGLPPFQNQYQNLDLPGEKFVLSMDGLKGTFTDEEHTQIYWRTTLSSEANKVAKVVQKIPLHKKIIILTHSFGGYILTKYIHQFKGDRIFGIIDIGGLPLIMHSSLHNVLDVLLSKGVNQKILIQQTDFLTKQYIVPTFDGLYVPPKNRFLVALWIKQLISEDLKNHYEWSRHYPSVLKLFLYGELDKLFIEELQQEKVIYYSYVNRLDPIYQQKMKIAYEKVYGNKVKNIQQKFVFSFEKGKHSLHMQTKYVQDVKRAIKQYLRILDISSNLQEPKL